MRHKLIAAGLFLSMAAGGVAHASDYPQRPIRMLLPFSAGGGGDTLGRYLAERFSAELGQPVVVENRPGAAGTIGTQAAASAPADGYTITIGGMSTHLLAPATYPNLPYDPIKDFTGLGTIGTSSIVMVAANDLPANDLKELSQLAASRNAPIQYASWGAGSTGHFCGEVLSQRAGIPMEHVPYKGTGQIMTDLLGGHISVAFVDMVTGTPFVQGKKAKALAVCTKRSPSLPDVASYSEQGVDFDQELNWAMYVPRGTPEPIVERLSEVLQKTLARPDTVEWLLGLGITADFKSGPEQEAAAQRDIAVWKDIARQANIKLD